VPSRCAAVVSVQLCCSGKEVPECLSEENEGTGDQGKSPFPPPFSKGERGGFEYRAVLGQWPVVSGRRSVKTCYVKKCRSV